MSPNATAPAIGAVMPDLRLIDADGNTASLHAARNGQQTVVYFLRASTCPACIKHSRAIAELAEAGQLGNSKVILIAPGARAEAQQLAERIPSAHVSVYASGSGHEDAGLGTFLNIQHSGTFLLNHDGTIAYRRTAALPPKSFNRKELLEATA
jgi:peroxiredoxin